MSLSNEFQSYLSEAAGAANVEVTAETNTEAGSVTQSDEGGQQQTETVSEEKTASEVSTKSESDQETVPEERFIEIKDEDGIKRKIKIDPKKSIEDYAKEVYNFQKGMRKFQRERDQALKAANSDAAKKWEVASTAFKKEGISGLINTLAENPEAYSHFEKTIAERAVKRALATEDELKEIDRTEEIERVKKEAERAKAERDEFMNSVKQEKYNAQKTAITSKLETAFDKYRLDGQLGNEAKEAKFNQIVWKETLDALEQYAVANKIEEHEIPLNIIHQTFKENAELFGNSVKELAQKEVVNQVEKRKAEATKNVRASSTNAAPKHASIEDLAEAHMKNGSISSFFKAFTQRTK